MNGWALPLTLPLQDFGTRGKPSNRRPLLAHLWVVGKGDELTAAALYEHELGFEVRIVDRAGVFVRTVVTRNEADAMHLAASHHDAYRAKGWVDLA